MLAGLSPSSGSGKLWVHRGGRAKPGAAARAHLGVSPRRRASSPGGSGLSGSGLRELYRAEREPRGRPRWSPRPGVLPAPAARAGPCPRMRPAPTRPLLPSRHPPLGDAPSSFAEDRNASLVPRQRAAQWPGDLRAPAPALRESQASESKAGGGKGGFHDCCQRTLNETVYFRTY
ncbi:unnamed protein product [Rangifer tarandus platyrhynchus]|uniref:Uncharacterized protein n=1 Tax=Rangifer tarandus platyrhynchus TaxID=3082113 RepID=A0AC60A9M9_RANTA